MPSVQPTELRYKKAEKCLHVTFDDGTKFDLPAEYLRVESPSAEVQGHSPDQKKLIHSRRHVGIMSIEPVGSYAVRLVFDDLHDTGFYTWDYLYELGSQYDDKWSKYKMALKHANLSRDPA